MPESRSNYAQVCWLAAAAKSKGKFMSYQSKNEMHLAGTLVKDPILKYTGTGKCVANLTVLTKYEQYSEFHKVVAWEKLAEKVEKLTKGDFVKVVGRLQTRSWDDKQTGRKKYITEIVAFQLVISSDEPAPLTPDATRQEPAKPAQSGTQIARAILRPADTRPSTSTNGPNIHGVHIDDSDIPF